MIMGEIADPEHPDKRIGNNEEKGTSWNQKSMVISDRTFDADPLLWKRILAPFGISLNMILTLTVSSSFGTRYD